MIDDIKQSIFNHDRRRRQRLAGGSCSNAGSGSNASIGRTAADDCSSGAGQAAAACRAAAGWVRVQALREQHHVLCGRCGRGAGRGTGAGGLPWLKCWRHCYLQPDRDAADYSSWPAGAGHGNGWYCVDDCRCGERLAEHWQGNAEYDLDKEMGVLTVDNGATTTLSNALFNMSDVQQCSVKISLASRGLSIKAIHREYKSFYIKDITAATHHLNHKCTAKALLCTGPPTRFISRKGSFKCSLSSNS